MAKIIWPPSTAPGEKTHESGGRLRNCYAEPLPEGAPAAYVIKRAPGLRSFADTSQTGYRGGIHADPYLYVAYTDVLRKVTSAGVVSVVGTLDGEEAVFFARNNKVPTPDQVVVTENGIYTFDDSSVSELVDGDLPQPNSVCAHDGYFFFTIADGRCFASGLNDITVNSNDYVKAESNPDGLLRGIPYGRDLLLCGQNTIEAFWNAGNATGFPYTRVTVIPFGLIGQKAIAGWEPEFGTKVVYVCSDFTVRLLAGGYEPMVISPPDLNRLIERTSDASTIEVSAFIAAGKSFAKVSGPGWCWVYDFTTKWWHERFSYLDDDWRFVGQTVKAFGKWLGGDSLSGKILEVADGFFREDTAPLIFEAESIAMEAFPTRLAVSRAEFNFTSGNGLASGEDPIERDPQIEVSWSDDGGINWSVPLLRRLGPQQEARTRVIVNRTGLTTAKGRRWRLRAADPVYISFLSADMTVEGRS